MRADLAEYGLKGWISPDAGEDVEIVNFGGGYADHDAYYVAQAIEYIRDWTTREENGENPEPFFMILPLVNPHDVLAYPQTYQDGGYIGSEWTEGKLEVPPSGDEDLMDNWKPDAQWQNKAVMAYGLEPVVGEKNMKEYVNFYGNLIKFVEEQIATVLEEFYHRKGGRFGKPKKLGEETLIVRLSDHGDMGMAHGGLRQKMFNVYEETMRVPILFSNPKMINSTGSPIKLNQIIGLIDVLPTLAGLVNIKPPKFINPTC